MSMADPDTMTLKEALKQPDAEEFLKAMVKEVEDHVRREHWKIMTISEMIASGCKGKPIMGVWSMKRKRNPLGVIAKHRCIWARDLSFGILCYASWF